MGLLDEAIREHLELKRRHGADAGEISKLENEAFGPVRRGEFAEPVVDQDEPVHVDADGRERAIADVPAPPTGLDELERAMEDEHPVVDAAPEDIAPPAAPVAEAPVDEQPVAPPPAVADELPPPPSPSPPERPRAPAEPLDEMPPAPPEAPDADATVAFSLDELEEADAAHEPAQPDPDVVAADEEPPDHDELEETPEFLQETPEHDRLWFEQKPPRDFDF